jgi:epoxyqueuosine reductase
VKTAIRERALELGFDACQFTTARPPGSAEQFRRWLEAGRHGRMAYLERNARKRIEPGQVLAAARSIITLAVSYAGEENFPGNSRIEPPNPPLNLNPDLNLNPPPAPTPSPLHPCGGEGRGEEALRFVGRTTRPTLPVPDQAVPMNRDCHFGEIARYARFSDYHDVLGGPLQSLAEFVNQLGGEDTRSLWYVDTGPLLERDLAQRAGLGFIGKHTNLISRKLGNWFFLAEIITTLALEPNAPEKNHCGSCRRCLAACPTGAILAPFQLDARRCISYLTIELKGPIPVELRAAMGHRIYGCDDCLAACPWNRFARAGAMMAGHRRAGLEGPDLVELLTLDEAAFQRRFAGTPILRARRRGFLRNVCVALGNMGGAEALPALQRAAADEEPLIAEHALWAIAQIKAEGRRQNKAECRMQNEKAVTALRPPRF